MATYGVYVKVDPRDNVVEINSDYYLMDLSAFYKIDEGSGLKYRDCAQHYLKKGIMSFGKTCAHFNYKYADGVIRERTDEEKEHEPYSSAEPEKQWAELDELLLELAGCPLTDSRIAARIHALHQDGKLTSNGLEKLKNLGLHV